MYSAFPDTEPHPVERIPFWMTGHFRELMGALKSSWKHCALDVPTEPNVKMAAMTNPVNRLLFMVRSFEIISSFLLVFSISRIPVLPLSAQVLSIYRNLPRIYGKCNYQHGAENPI
jgi:hypothetical protein